MRSVFLNRRAFLRVAGATAALGLWAGIGVGQEETARRKPNFVFFLVDDLGWMDLGCYGSTFYETPNIDGLAAEGMRFTDAFAASPVCSPTRASIMTGKHPARLGITQWIGGHQEPTPYQDYLPVEEMTIAAALKADGYATGSIGKWHLAKPDKDRAEYYPERYGFEINVGGDTSGLPPTYVHP